MATNNFLEMEKKLMIFQIMQKEQLSANPARLRTAAGHYPLVFRS